VTPARRRILVATVDTLTAKMAGPAIRAWHIASALAAEHDVELVTTSSCDVTDPGFRARSVTGDELEAAVAWCDVVLFQGFLANRHPFLLASDKVVITDIYDPIHLETLEQSRDHPPTARRDSVDAATTVLNEQLLRGDFFICASEKQRDFWLGQLAALGRINPLTYDEDETLVSLIDVVPFGIAETAPVHTRPAVKGVVPGIGPDDKVLLWAGGLYNWFDPLTLIRAVDKLRTRVPEVRLLFMGLRHPNPEVPEMRIVSAARQLADELGLIGRHVFFNEDWVAYEDRQNYLLEADVGVSTHLDHVETAFSFRTRILDYVWAALPIVATGGDAFASLIDSRGLGVTVPPGDVDALEAALFRVVSDADFARACRSNLANVAPEFLWSRALRPLMEFCRRPRRAPDLVDADWARRLRWQLGVATPPHRSVRSDLRGVGRALREGGPRLLVARARARLRH